MSSKRLGVFQLDEQTILYKPKREVLEGGDADVRKDGHITPFPCPYLLSSLPAQEVNRRCFWRSRARRTVDRRGR
jgi:hypothetical protein